MASDFFYNRKVNSYNPSEGITEKNAVYLLAVEDFDEDDDTFNKSIQQFLNEPNLSEVVGLIIGAWPEAFECSCKRIIDMLIQNTEKLQHLEAIFIGDMESEECEISWINQTNLNPIFTHFPNLKEVSIKGSEGLEIGMIDHPKLEALNIYTGGLPKKILNDLAKANLPQLKSLVLWLGDENYGYNAEPETDISPLLEEGKFPSLEKIGLCDSVDADDIGNLIKNVGLPQKVTTLDMSMGILSDEGAKALMMADSVKKLHSLNVSNNYLSVGMIEELKSALPEVKEILTGGQKEDDHYHGEVYRYIDVSE